MTRPLPQPGLIALVRQRQYLIESVTPPPEVGQATLVALSCLDDDAQGEPLSVLWEHELDAQVLEEDGWQVVAEKGLGDPPLFAAYLRTLSWNCVTATDPNLFQAPFRAGIRLDLYQLEPLRKALRLPRVNLFIADDVGLGKTIEASLIARELLLRRRIDRIVAPARPRCSSSGVTKWKPGSGSCSRFSTGPASPACEGSAGLRSTRDARCSRSWEEARRGRGPRGNPVHRRPTGGTNTTAASQIREAFARDFSEREWPGTRLLRLYFDPRSLEPGTDHRSALHAKCVVVDGEHALVTSANFTAAAQERNIELGVVIDSRSVAERIERHFLAIIENEDLKRLPLQLRRARGSKPWTE